MVSQYTLSQGHNMEFITIKIKDGKEWKEVKMDEIKAGNKFRCWQPDGTIIRKNNKYVFTAAEDAHKVEHEGTEVTAINCGE